VDKRTGTFDATGSSDDGTITSYQWNFGDGQSDTTTSPTTTHVYAAPGNYTATLKVTDDKGVSDTTTNPVVVTNAAPDAAFGTTIDKLKVSANGGGSSDSDGTVASYDWAWGDGTGHDSGVNATHAYAAAGTYTVTLTATDNDGTTGTVSHDVTVKAADATPTLVASDDFGRTVSSGWGSADTGGAWTVAGTKANYGVSGGTGSIAMPTPGIGPSVNLAGLSSSSSDVQVSVSPQQVPTGSGSFVSVFGRQVAGVGTYRAVVNLRSNGTVSLTIVRVDGAGQATVVPAAIVSGLTYAAGDKLNLRMQATGTSPTVLRAKVWKDGQAEPGWQLSGSDGAGAMQAAGSIGLMSYLATNATAGTTNRFDTLRVFDTTGVAQAAVVQQLAARQASPHPSDDDPPVNQQVSP
jgi:PKD repeat protein